MLNVDLSIVVRAASLASFALWITLFPASGVWGQVYEGREIPGPAEIQDSFRVAVVGKNEIPQLLRDAFVAADDPNFFQLPSHQTVFTEQIVKSEFLPFAEKSTIRKQRIRLISLEIEATLSLDEILNWYMNRVWLGGGCYGVADAAFAYFGKKLSALSIGEAAFMAALPKYATILSRPESYGRAIKARNRVIEAMLILDYIPSHAASKEKELELVISYPLSDCGRQ